MGTVGRKPAGCTVHTNLDSQSRYRQLHQAQQASLTMEKYVGILCLLNLLLLISSTACLYFGSILVNFYLLPYLETVNAHCATVPYLILAIGAILLLLSMYGIVAAGSKSRPLLVIYAVIASVVVILQLASVFVSMELKNDMELKTMFVTRNSEIVDEMEKYWEDDDVKYKWDTIQRDFQCCGAFTFRTGYQDWTRSQGHVKRRGVPDSCCLEEDTGCGENDLDIFGDKFAYEKIYVHGCLAVMKEKLTRDIVPNLLVYIGCCVLLCLITIISLVLAAAFVASISRAEGGDDGLGMYQPPHPGNRYEETDIVGLKTLDSGLGGGSLRSVHTSPPRTPIIKPGAPNAHRASLYVEPSNESGTVI